MLIDIAVSLWLILAPCLLVWSGERFAQSRNIIGHKVHFPLSVENTLSFNRWSPNHAIVAHRLYQNIADGSISPHEYSDSFLEGVAGQEKIVELTFTNGVFLALESLDNLKGDLVGSVAGSGILIAMVGVQVLDLALSKRLLHFFDHLLHVLRDHEVFLQVANLHICALNHVNFFHESR